MKTPLLLIALLLAACSQDDSRSAGEALGRVSAGAGDVIAPTVTGAAQGFVDGAIRPQLDAMLECQRRRAPASRVTETAEVKGRPVKECLAENGGVINEAVMRCRNGYQTTQTREVPYSPNPAIQCP